MPSGFSFKNKRNKLRFGIILEKNSLCKWEAKCVEKLLSVGNTELKLVILLKHHADFNKQNFHSRLFWKVYYSLVKHKSTALRIVDKRNMESIFSGVSFVQQSDIEKIRDYYLDFLIYFGTRKIDSEILNVSRLGVWAFFDGNAKQNYDIPFGFWEIYRNEKITKVSLQKLAVNSNRSRVLKEGFFKTINDSYVKNFDSIYLEIAEWPAEICRSIENNGFSYFEDLRNLGEVDSSSLIKKIPSNTKIILFLFKLLINRFAKWYNYLFFYECCNLGISQTPIHTFLKKDRMPAIKWLTSPARSKFSADPFPITVGNDIYVLFEEYDYSIFKGYISTIRIHNGVVSLSEKVWESPFHMSYPYLLEYKNNIYCIPETSQAHEVALYKANSFPNDWVKVTTLIKGFGGIDNTIFQYNGKWWLLSTDINDRPAFHRLIIWYADNLFGPWKPHSGNPVKIDVRSARSAGTPFVHNGNLYRPTQDCSGNYGGKIIINKVLRLTPTEFLEEEVTTIEPDRNGPYPDGMHTISGVKNITIVDGVKRVFTIRNPLILLHKLQHIFL